VTFYFYYHLWKAICSFKLF